MSKEEAMALASASSGQNCTQARLLVSTRFKDRNTLKMYSEAPFRGTPDLGKPADKIYVGVLRNLGSSADYRLQMEFLTVPGEGQLKTAAMLEFGAALSAGEPGTECVFANVYVDPGFDITLQFIGWECKLG